MWSNSLIYFVPKISTPSSIVDEKIRDRSSESNQERQRERERERERERDRVKANQVHFHRRRAGWENGIFSTRKKARARVVWKNPGIERHAALNSANGRVTKEFREKITRKTKQVNSGKTEREEKKSPAGVRMVIARRLSLWLFFLVEMLGRHVVLGSLRSQNENERASGGARSSRGNEWLCKRKSERGGGKKKDVFVSGSW